MKKLLLLLPILILGISASVWQHYQNEPTLSDTALANLEALAGGDDGNTEGGGSSESWTCWSSQKAGDPHDGYWRCGKPCVWMEGVAPDSGKGKCTY